MRQPSGYACAWIGCEVVAVGRAVQVENDNQAALRLYAGAGFRPVCHYHYRTQLLSAAAPSAITKN